VNSISVPHYSMPITRKEEAGALIYATLTAWPWRAALALTTHCQSRHRTLLPRSDEFRPLTVIARDWGWRSSEPVPDIPTRPGAVRTFSLLLAVPIGGTAGAGTLGTTSVPILFIRS
jgi:hypothetical protein